MWDNDKDKDVIPVVDISSDEDEIDYKPDIKKIRLAKQNSDPKNFFKGSRDIVFKPSRKQASLQNLNQIVGLIPDSKDESFFENNPDYFIEDGDEFKTEVWISDFSIFDKKNRMRFLDSIEETDKFMLNGFVTPITSDVHLRGTAIMAGPIDRLWWISGYLPGESIVVTVTTETVNYNLKVPAKQYQAYFNEVLEKAYYVKFVIELTKYGENDKKTATLEDLQQRIKRSDSNFPRDYCKPSLSRLRNASKFIMKQIENFEDHSDDDDDDSILDSDLIKCLEIWIEEDDNCKIRPSKKLAPPQRTTPVVFGNFSASFSPLELSCCLTKSDKNKVVTLNEEDIEIVDEVISGKSMEHEEVPEVKPPRWNDEPIHSSPSCKTYNSVFYKNKNFFVNDYVIMSPRTGINEHFSIGQITKLFSKNGADMMHVHFFSWTRSLLRRKQYNNKELFLHDDCADVEIKTLRDKAQVIFKSFGFNWRNTGGLEVETPESFFCHKWYDKKQSRFTDIPSKTKTNCLSCDYKSAQKEYEKPTFCQTTKSITWQGIQYMVGNDVFVNQPRILSPKQDVEEPCTSEKQRRYPEMSRKPKSTQMMSSHSLFKIGRIKQFIQPNSNSGDENMEVELELFHRSEDETEDLNYLYYTVEREIVKFKDIEGKCHVKYGKPKLADEFTPDFFYFLKGYNINHNKFYELPSDLTCRSEDLNFKHDLKLRRKLNALDLFCGCGGLSEGFKMAGLVEIRYAVDIDQKAANSFQLNNPGTTVFNIDCSLFVKLLQEGKSCYNGKPCPKRGDVQIIMAGPPCQGFSPLNRFRNLSKSQAQNASIATFFSIVDILRPDFFILENINFSASHQDILKIILGTGLEIGYQLAFGLLISGNYGVPQSRTRFFVFGAAPGKKLPLFPEPIFQFKTPKPWPTIKINDKICTTNIKRLLSVPFRGITVADAINDLPIIENEDSSTVYGEPKSHYQRLMRKNCLDKELNYHFCKQFPELESARIERIPKSGLNPNWKNLPNSRIELSNGEKTDILIYSHSHHEGIICQKKACMPKQSNTLIPWTMVHTADGNSQWNSAYGRLSWDSTFSTVTTIQRLERKERIVHPDQDRVLSIQEYARAQGFCDHFQFYGGPADQLKQIGNAVPVLLAKAIAIEFLKAQF